VLAAEFGVFVEVFEALPKDALGAPFRAVTHISCILYRRLVRQPEVTAHIGGSGLFDWIRERRGVG